MGGDSCWNISSTFGSATNMTQNRRAACLIFNDRYSDNLGDGVIAECLERVLTKSLPHCQILTVDISNLSCYPAGADVRGPAFAWAEALMRIARSTRLARIAARVSAGARLSLVYKKAMRMHLTDCAAIVIGGGNLISGSSDYFARRLQIIVALCRELKIPILIYSVGVVPLATWERDAAARLKKTFRSSQNIVFVSTRDQRSTANWSSIFEGREPEICRDPGLLAAEVYESALGGASVTLANSKDGRPRVGIGVINGSLLIGTRTISTAVSAEIHLYSELAFELIRAGCHPIYFTNGNNHDESTLSEVKEYNAKNHPEIANLSEYAIQPRTPEELVTTIAQFHAIVAHRMHANIIAYSLRIPHVGLSWEKKIEDFFESVGRNQFLVKGGVDARATVGIVMDAMKEGIDLARHAEVLGEAHNGVTRLAGALQLAVHLREPKIGSEKRQEHEPSNACDRTRT